MGKTNVSLASSIKTINGNSILGTGDLTVASVGTAVVDVIAYSNTNAVTSNAVAERAISPYPFHAQSTFDGISDNSKSFIKDLIIDGGDKNWRVSVFNAQRNLSTIHQIRIAVYQEDGITLDTTVGSSGLIGTFSVVGYVEPAETNGTRLDTLELTPSGCDRIRLVVDWNKLASGAQILPKNYNTYGFDSKCFKDNFVYGNSIKSELPLAEENVWERQNILTLGNLKEAILDCKIYGASATKRYGVEQLRMDTNPSSRSFISICEFSETGVKGSRVAIFDNLTYTLPTAVNGRQISDLTLVESSGSGIVAEIKIDWAKIPRSGTFWNGSGYWYTNTFQKRDGIFSQKTYQSTYTPNGYFVKNFQIDGVDCRLTTSDGYTNTGESDYLMLLMHGNGGDYTYTPSASFVAFCKANKISFACTNGQDETTTPFTTNASGWGNEVYLTRFLKLQKHLASNYNFHESVILVGASMGGLAMGHFAYTRPFPILFCLGVGSVPDLELIFNTGGTTRKEPIRNAYGMASDGSDDANLSVFTQGYNWNKKGLIEIASVEHRLFMPHIYLYLGTGDTTATVEFGGIANYNSIKDSINRTGGYCVTKDIGNSYTHADNEIYNQFLSDGILNKELGI